MSTISDSLLALQTKVQANTTELGSLTTLLGGLHDQLEAALANGDQTAALASISAISASIDKNTDSIAAAVLANTPAAVAPAAVAPAAVVPASTVVAPTVPSPVPIPAIAPPVPSVPPIPPYTPVAKKK